MIIKTEYLSNLTADQIEEYTELCIDEVEELIGTFSSRSRWSGKLRGEIRFHSCGKVDIFNNFKNKKNKRCVVWDSEV